MSSTISLKTTVSITSRFIYNSPMLYVNDGELAYSIGDWTRQFLLAPPFAWRWNRAETSFVCNPGQTDYSLNISDFGWLERARLLYPEASGTPITLYNYVNILAIAAVGTTVTATVNGNPLNFGFYVGQTISVQNVTDSTFNSFQNIKVKSLGPNTIVYTLAGTGSSSSGGIVFNLVTSSVPTITKQRAYYKRFLSSRVCHGSTRFYINR